MDKGRVKGESIVSIPTSVNMKINKKSTKLIKPQTPTPENLKNYKISMVDQFMESMNIAVVLFYESKSENKPQLEESLARILVEFYPLAGRYMKNDQIVDCNDEGAELIEAEASDVESMTIKDLGAKTDLINDLLPNQYFQVDEEADDPLLSIQATQFPCGGLAVAISVSHRVFDVASLGTFIAAWSKTCRDAADYELELPSFHIPSLLPYMDLGGLGSTKFIAEAGEIVVKKLLFSKEALTSLRSKIGNETTSVSRVRVVCAVIAKALAAVDRAKRGGRNRGLVIIQPINMRERTIPPQPKRVCGNLSIPTHTRRVDGGVGIEELVGVLGESVEKSIGEYANIIASPYIILNSLGNITQHVMDPEINAVVFTDWSKFGFYEADFGFGKPVWTGIGPQRPAITTTVLTSDKEGHGIEAWLHLNKSDVPYFDQLDEEFKLFTA